MAGEGRRHSRAAAWMMAASRWSRSASSLVLAAASMAGLASSGRPPAKAVERLRVEAARGALESGEASLQRLARQCGFGEVERMRRSFLRILGAPPSALKR
ncbi:helix-turn-helix domain-containing protein [Chromobacterium subtsugae]|uniref:Helix-turn-helix domain-containing protein n=2 Tax=Chromobacteriaceae TaxID=1499392 RepID=A0ABS7F9R3_9NEIS|nr:helix-turn-helix domain-containing protein [Chromobacterium subtsugae]MBW8286717.1 helix-turn-helix domain-containing protein [Chromobacterium subtsugae]